MLKISRKGYIEKKYFNNYLLTKFSKSTIDYAPSLVYSMVA